MKQLLILTTNTIATTLIYTGMCFMAIFCIPGNWFAARADNMKRKR